MLTVVKLLIIINLCTINLFIYYVYEIKSVVLLVIYCISHLLHIPLHYLIYCIFLSSSIAYSFTQFFTHVLCICIISPHFIHLYTHHLSFVIYIHITCLLSWCSLFSGGVWLNAYLFLTLPKCALVQLRCILTFLLELR